MANRRKQPGELGEVNFVQTPRGWKARARVRTGSGEVRRLSASGPTAEAARARLEESANELWVGGSSLGLGPDSTVAALGKVWLEECAVGDNKAQTLEKYESTFRNAILPRIGAYEIRNLTAGFVDTFLNRLRREKGNAYAKSARKALSRMCRIAVLHGAMSTNPVRDADPIPASKPVYVRYDAKQLGVMIFLIRGWRGASPDRRGGARPDIQLLEDSLLMILGSSLRPGELLALRRNDVSFVGGALKLAPTGTSVSSKATGTIRQEGLKNDRQERMITAASFCGPIVRRRMADYIHSEDGLLFATRNGRVIQVGRLAKLYKEFADAHAVELRAIGVNPDTFRPRALRKTAAKIVEEALGLEAAKQLLGHSDSRITRHHYAAEEVNVSPDIADALDAALIAGILQVDASS